jgi:hypothetical protein
MAEYGKVQSGGTGGRASADQQHDALSSKYQYQVQEVQVQVVSTSINQEQEEISSSQANIKHS